jgi:lysophospholipase L1-like esterase
MNDVRINRLFHLLYLMIGLCAVMPGFKVWAAADGMPASPRTGDRVVFFGDSITAGGWSNPGGYVRLAEDGLRKSGVAIEVVPAGVAGHTSRDMLERFDRDVLEKEPDWLVISCGVNDVWHRDQGKGVTIEEFESNLREMIQRASAKGVSIVLLSASLVGEDLSSEKNTEVGLCNEVLRKLALEHRALFSDVHSMLAQEVARHPGADRLVTKDGVHMNPVGDAIMASTLLQTWGISSARLEEFKADWDRVPDATKQRLTYRSAGAKRDMVAIVPITTGSFRALQAAYFKRDQLSAIDGMKKDFAQAVQQVMTSRGLADDSDSLFDKGLAEDLAGEARRLCIERWDTMQKVSEGAY